MEPLLLSCIESRVENSRNFYGRFQLGPFVSGQALTIANSLRRSLLSEISGLAITAVEIEGAAHEYSTLSGVRESVLDLLLNVKQIVLTSNFQFQEPQIAFLEVQGPAIVRATDIKLPVSVQSVDPEQYIATLLYDGILKMKFIICRGKNYIVQTPLGLKIPDSISEATQAEIDLTKPSQVLKQNLNYNTSLSKENDSQKSLRYPTTLPQKGVKISDFKGRQTKGDERENSVLTSKTSKNDINNDIANNLSHLTSHPFEKKTFLPDPLVKRGIRHGKEEMSPLYQTVSFQTKEGSRQGISEGQERVSDMGDDIATLNTQNQLKNSRQSPISSTEVLLNNNKTDLYSSSTSKKNKNIEQVGELDETDQAQEKEFKKTENILPIDAVFMPINKVNFAIETNDQSEAPKDRIILEIWTNGSIHPKQAINDAAKALIQLIAPFQETKNFKSVFLNSPKVLQRALSSSKTKKNLKLMPHPLLNRNLASLDIGNLDLSLRPYTCLKRAKIETVADLLQYSSEELLNLKHFGKHSLNEVESILNQMGLKLRSQKVDDVQASL
uniref:DNA-directed RNA polymerase subunit alpha n=1 Tax=Trebouxia lynnae TaxID=1825957 RepID=A0A6B9VNN3_9CHLO|nr:alpha subunit of RNA polymerase [Trebouxia lynnae]QHO63902.1 alpha subunit of RNA polymerase [Trebouxia lynnae]